MIIPHTVRMNDGRYIPQIGLGVLHANHEETVTAVREALLAGYRHVDTAANYKNEQDVGQGIVESGISREDVFITTKIWNEAQGEASTRIALFESLEKLKVDSVDLLLIHWPAPERNLFVETWQTLIDLQKEGLAKSIGVSNFTAQHLQRLINETGVTPCINQIELHPYFQQGALRKVHEHLNVRTQAWSPLAQNLALADPTIQRIAEKHGKSPAQIVIRWHIDNQFVVIPKSVTPSRIRANLDILNFVLDADDMTSIQSLDSSRRLGPDPEDFN
nr:aldo/keto reductase [Paraburkholderia tropica]